MKVSLFDSDPIFLHQGSKFSGSIPAKNIGLRPNPASIASVLQFGAIIPPYSPWQGIARAVPEDWFLSEGLSSETSERVSSCIKIEQQSDLIESYIDRALKARLRDNKKPVVLFSGGVDSGFIASRLAALGRTDALLVNFAFGKDDPESAVAEVMAKQLGLDFQRVYSKGIGLSCLDAPGKIWPLPFGDHSTVPTSEVALAVIGSISPDNALIIDGTGADGALGMVNKIRKWELLNSLPGFFSGAGAYVYKKFDLAFQQSAIEHYLKLLRRAGQFDVLSGLIAQNPLSGIAYADDFREELVSSLGHWIDSSIPGLSSTGRVVAVDMALTCSNIFVQKARPIYRSAGFDSFYPFLDDGFAELALCAADFWEAKEPKSTLKYSLCRKVDRNLVYRPKSGFTAPPETIFHSESFLESLRCLQDPKSNLSNILYRKFLIKSLDHLHKGNIPPPQTLNFLWSAVFLDRWYKTV